MLSIGSVQGGPEVASAPIGVVLGRLMRLATEERGDFKFGSSAALNVVFHVPGSLAANVGYKGLRDGTFSRSRQLLMIQVAVPQDVAVSKDEASVQRFLFDSLRKASRIATEFFERNGIDFSQPKYLAMVDALEKKCAQTGSTLR